MGGEGGEERGWGEERVGGWGEESVGRREGGRIHFAIALGSTYNYDGSMYITNTTGEVT